MISTVKTDCEEVIIASVDASNNFSGQIRYLPQVRKLEKVFGTKGRKKLKTFKKGSSLQARTRNIPSILLEKNLDFFR